MDPDTKPNTGKSNDARTKRCVPLACTPRRLAGNPWKEDKAMDSDTKPNTGKSDDSRRRAAS